jgi:hypothetical protein
MKLVHFFSRSPHGPRRQNGFVPQLVLLENRSVPAVISPTVPAAPPGPSLNVGPTPALIVNDLVASSSVGAAPVGAGAAAAFPSTTGSTVNAAPLSTASLVGLSNPSPNASSRLQVGGVGNGIVTPNTVLTTTDLILGGVWSTGSDTPEAPPLTSSG